MIKRAAFWVILALGFLMGSCGDECYAQFVTVTGTITGSNGATASNYTLTFVPSQTFFVAGTGAIVPSASNCSTSIDGTVVGIGNPLTTTTVTANFSGSLPVGTYYVRYSFYTNTSETLASPEQSVQLTSTGRLQISIPASGLPAKAVGMRIYIGSSPGSETLQGSTQGTNSYIQSTALITGAALPLTNTTTCVQVANDAGWPTGTGYQVSMVDSAGNAIPGYPMLWQLLGPNTTIDLSSGIPYYHGIVYYPSPILASPINHATQSISGSLDFGGVWKITNVLSINNGFTGTKTAGGCTFVIAGGIITNVTGC